MLISVLNPNLRGLGVTIPSCPAVSVALVSTVVSIVGAPPPCRIPPPCISPPVLFSYSWLVGSIGGTTVPAPVGDPGTVDAIVGEDSDHLGTLGGWGPWETMVAMVLGARSC
jgi:hypothetical protein